VAVVPGRSREQIRQSIGYNAGVLRVSATTTGSNTRTDVVDSSLRGPDNEHKGKFVWFTSGTNDEEVSVIDSSVEATNRAVLKPAVSTTIASGVTFEIWDEDCDPVRVNEFINNAIEDQYGRVFVPDDDISLYADGRTTRFPVPSNIVQIGKFEVRTSVPATEIHNCQAAWDESTTNTTVTVDNKLFKRGQGACKFVVDAAASAADILATDSFASKDISNRTHFEGWVWSDIATVAGDLQLLLDDTASCASPLESLNIPALTARTWLRLHIALANPELDTALISVGLKLITDNGAQIIYLDALDTVNQDAAIFEPVNVKAWGIAREANEIWLSLRARDAIGHAMLRIIGGKVPTLLNADATAADIDDWYIICRATELTLSMLSRADDPTDRDKKLLMWAGRADIARRQFARNNGRLVT